MSLSLTMAKIYLKDILERDITIDLDFRNLTSETPFIESIAMSEASAAGCVLKLPAKSCSSGHQVLLRFVITKEAEKTVKPIKIEIIGKVTKLEKIDENSNEVLLQFNQFVKDEWKYILDSLDKKQEIINQVMDKLKSTDVV